MKPAEYHVAARQLKAAKSSDDVDARVAILSSHSLEFLDPFLLVEADAQDYSVATRYSPFGQLEQALIADDAVLIEDCDACVIALRIEDQSRYAYLTSVEKNPDELRATGRDAIERLLSCVNIIRQSSAAEILLANFSLPLDMNSNRLFDANNPDGKDAIVNALNRDLASAVLPLPGVSVWDYAGLVRQHGSRNWTDQRLWQVARQSIAPDNRAAAARHLAASLKALTRPRSKCLVLDLDNTLWGGVAGDDGLDGIALGDDYPGLPFKDFQQAVRSLADQGILLSLCSKNDVELAKEIIDKHPDMQLAWDDFVAPAINWEPKSQNLKRIAESLNIGLDSLVFFDDSPVEREEVRLNAPEVAVIEVPPSPLDYADALFDCGRFDTLSLSGEDLERASYYRNDERRRSSSSTFDSIDQFLSSLEMQATLGDVATPTLARAVHLVSKTNQFNLTTRRHSEARITAMAADSDWDIRWLQVADRFGDNGIIGLTATRYDTDIAEIDSFIMSCRVMNRHIEDTMLADLVQRAIARGVSTIRGLYAATDRNSIVADFYLDRGFAEVESGEDGVRSFEIKADTTGLDLWPAAVTVTAD